jgi:hypothetical protein
VKASRFSFSILSPVLQSPLGQRDCSEDRAVVAGSLEDAFQNFEVALESARGDLFEAILPKLFNVVLGDRGGRKFDAAAEAFLETCNRRPVTLRGALCRGELLALEPRVEELLGRLGLDRLDRGGLQNAVHKLEAGGLRHFALGGFLHEPEPGLEELAGGLGRHGAVGSRCRLIGEGFHAGTDGHSFRLFGATGGNHAPLSGVGIEE